MYSFLKKYGTYLAGMVFILPALFLYLNYFLADQKDAVRHLEHEVQSHIQELTHEQEVFFKQFSLQNDAQAAWKSSRLDFRYTPALFLYQNNHLIFLDTKHNTHHAPTLR